MMNSVHNCSEPHLGLHTYAYEGKPTDLDVANTEEVVTSSEPTPASPEPIPYKGKDIELNGFKQEEAAVVWHQYMNKPEDKIPVKALRKLIPQGFKECYHQNDDDSTKKKLKHQWDDRPADWPENVPFVDPNNGVRSSEKGSGKSTNSVCGKPGKEKLLEMYRFLRLKYEQCPRDKSGKYCSENGGLDNLRVSFKRVVWKLNNVIMALTSSRLIQGSENDLKQIGEILQVLYKEAQNGFEEKKRFYDVSHTIEKHMDLAAEDLSYIFTCPDLQNILETYRPQGTVPEQQFYDASKNVEGSHPMTSKMCLSLDNKVGLPENQANTYYNIVSEDIKTAIIQPVSTRIEGTGIALKTGNTPAPVIDLKSNKIGIQESSLVKSEELTSCKVMQHPVTMVVDVDNGIATARETIQQEAMATMQPNVSSLDTQNLDLHLLFGDDNAMTPKLDMHPELNPAANGQIPSVYSHATQKMQATEQVVGCRTSLMDVNPVNQAVNQVQQQCESQGQQGNHPFDQLDQPPGQQESLTTLLLEWVTQQVEPRPNQALVNRLDQPDILVCEPDQPQQQVRVLENQTPTDLQGQPVHDHQAGAGVQQEYNLNEMENGEQFINADDEQLMKNVQSLEDDYGTPATFLTHSKTKIPSAEVECNVDSPGTEMAVDASPLIPVTVEEMEKSDDEMEMDSPRCGSKRSSFSNDHNMETGGKRPKRF